MQSPCSFYFIIIIQLNEWMTRNRHSEDSYHSVFKPFLLDFSYLSEEGKEFSTESAGGTQCFSTAADRWSEHRNRHEQNVPKIRMERSTFKIYSSLPTDGRIIITSEAFYMKQNHQGEAENQPCCFEVYRLIY